MSPVTTAFSLDLDHHSSSRREINGLRPSPLRIHKDSHLIHKSSSSVFAKQQPQEQRQRQQQHGPVIIYTHSPKIIHTKPQDFMALVQKLTGRSSSDDQIISSETTASDQDFKSETNVVRENSTGVDLNTRHEDSRLADIPLFTPTSAADFFCSPNKANPISPSFLEFLRGFSDY
ncbi:hypothetical protein HS088_TW02G00939 [Tripterygium wilfordii]|uniref:VQ domain-containing protein n=1 Tax=Tripterygium wilfordii TaxID=458696 RepID=A0A7J7DZV2_TRIWF|nr:VQ motif-containing protein 8, chloroplastic-like [Tripterygium wilfordii]KAF5751920.1 hypothetical protein HS088_TW02G00939 [Tripterygium wilfordii]